MTAPLEVTWTHCGTAQGVELWENQFGDRVARYHVRDVATAFTGPIMDACVAALAATPGSLHRVEEDDVTRASHRFAVLVHRASIGRREYLRIGKARGDDRKIRTWTSLEAAQAFVAGYRELGQEPPES